MTSDEEVFNFVKKNNIMVGTVVGQTQLSELFQIFHLIMQKREANHFSRKRVTLNSLSKSKENIK